MKILLILYVILITMYFSILVTQLSTWANKQSRGRLLTLLSLISLPLTVVGLALITMVYGV